MTAKITSKEVLIYLNYLGYNNINAQQLKEFVQDLKKLIKYEERRKSEENFQTDSVCVPNAVSNVPTKHKQSSEYVSQHRSNSKVQEPDIFTILHSHGTFASEARTASKKNVISLQIKRSKCHHHCAQHNKENVLPELVQSKENEQSETLENKTKNSQLLEKTSNKENMSKKSCCSLKPKSSFIRPPIRVINKSDPVALYHYYKAGWERHRVPGEDQRTDLRWTIRERMLSGPRVSRT